MASTGSVTFVDAVRLGFTRLFDFRGRSSRSEFWYWVLFLFIIRLVTSTADAFIYPEDLDFNPNTIGLDNMVAEMTTVVEHTLRSITFAVEMLFLVPTLAVTVRRFRDGGWKPWLAWFSYVGVYLSALVSLLVAFPILEIVTASGISESDQSMIVAGFLVLVVAMLFDFASLLILIIGGSQPSQQNADS